MSGTPAERDFSGWSASVSYLRPASRGETRLRSSDLVAPTAIYRNYLNHPKDPAALIAALRRVDQIDAMPGLNSLLVRRLASSENLNLTKDRSVDGNIRAFGNTINHPVGTSKMGGAGEAVVDNLLRVHGVSGLRLADAAIMPTIVSSDTNAPAIIIGAMAAWMIMVDNAAGSRTVGSSTLLKPACVPSPR
ncbi:GMC oxidoreductase [Novosphingobium olei]|uniref:GMC oxidoreductase n=1 Tax=Novosphingobium olei TaxID=2728851 RepID=UPI0030B8851F